MATIYDLKPAFQNLLRPIVHTLARQKVTPNQITLLALVLSLLWGTLIACTQGAKWTLLGLPFILFIRMGLNAIDGMLAKEHHMKSTLGAILNELGDVISDVALYLPFALVEGVDIWYVVFFVIASLLSEMAGILTQAIGHTRRYDGPMGKSDRAFVVGSMALILGCGVVAYPWVNIVFVVMTILSLWTIINRCQKGLG